MATGQSLWPQSSSCRVFGFVEGPVKFGLMFSSLGFRRCIANTANLIDGKATVPADKDFPPWSLISIMLQAMIRLENCRYLLTEGKLQFTACICHVAQPGQQSGTLNLPTC